MAPNNADPADLGMACPARPPRTPCWLGARWPDTKHREAARLHPHDLPQQPAERTRSGTHDRSSPRHPATEAGAPDRPDLRATAHEGREATGRAEQRVGVRLLRAPGAAGRMTFPGCSLVGVGPRTGWPGRRRGRCGRRLGAGQAGPRGQPGVRMQLTDLAMHDAWKPYDSSAAARPSRSSRGASRAARPAATCAQGRPRPSAPSAPAWPPLPALAPAASMPLPAAPPGSPGTPSTSPATEAPGNPGPSPAGLSSDHGGSKPATPQSRQAPSPVAVRARPQAPRRAAGRWPARFRAR